MKDIRKIRSFIILCILLLAVSGCGVQEKKDYADKAGEQTVVQPATEDAQSESALSEADWSAIADGTYPVEVVLEGGSGRASVTSPTQMTVENGIMTVQITWSSSHYDYMIVGDGEKIYPVNSEGNSVFEFVIPGLDEEIAVVADTTAMGTPHEIAYVLTFHREGYQDGKALQGDSTAINSNAQIAGDENGPEWNSLQVQDSLKLDYAKQYYVTYLTDGYKQIHIDTIGEYLLVPEGKPAPKNVPEDMMLLRAPLQQVYLAATSAMDLICRIEELPSVTMCGVKQDGWYVPEAVEAMESGKLQFAGKYSAPDYEMLLSRECDVAIESTMILHNPEVKEQLERIGIPVLIERSSYEEHPLGRLEWIKLYGALWDKEELAEQYYTQQKRLAEQVFAEKKTGKTIGFFSFTTTGAVVVQKSNGYIPKMIELAGGDYVLGAKYESDSSLSTMTMQMEEFYRVAVEADYLVYNGSINGGMNDLAQLLQVNPLMADFKAVKEGHIYSCGKDMFQKVSQSGDIIEDFRKIMTEENSELKSMYKLN